MCIIHSRARSASSPRAGACTVSFTGSCPATGFGLQVDAFFGNADVVMYAKGHELPDSDWKIEETFRFIKQSYNLEDIRVMKYQRLKNLVILVTAVAYFAATFLGQQIKLRILCEKLMIISQRFFGIPPFRFYALADGIRRILAHGTCSPPKMPPPSQQLELTMGWEG